MSEKKNIERLFQEKFKDFEATPPPIVWDKIEAELKKKKDRKVIPLWLRLSGVAAILLMGFLVGDGIINNSTEINTSVVNQEEKPNSNGGKELVPMQNSIKSDEIVTDASDSKNEESNKNGLSESNSGENNSSVSETGGANGSNNTSGKNNQENNPIASQETSRDNKNNTLKNKGNNNANKMPNNTNTTGIANNSKTGKQNKNKSKEGIFNNPALDKNKGALANQEGSKSKENNKQSNNPLDKNLNSNQKNNSGIAQNNNKSQLDNPTNKNNALANQEGSKSKENDKQSNALDKNLNSNQKNNSGIAQNKNLDSKSLENNNNTSQIAFDIKALEEQKKDSTAVATVEPNPLEELLKEKEKEQQAVTETKVNRWQITSTVAPIYFSSASNGSPVASQFADNSKEYEKNMSYGVGVNYALNKKWSVRGGVNKLTLGYNTNDIVYYAGLSDASARGIMSNNIQAKGTAIIVEDNSAENLVSFDNVPGKIAGSLNQTMGYIEVPVELSYKVLDKKFGIELIGGMSTMFLNENNLSVVSPGMSASIGKATNLNDVSFTSNIGVGFKYRFWKSFEANVEPKLKYQINTFSENAGGFKPYFIGLYSGISFNF